MHRPFQHLEYDVQDGVFCVRLKNKLDEEALEELGVEWGCLISEQGCRKMVLNLGPDDLECLYSLLLAKLVNLQRRMHAVGGTLVLAELSANTQDVFSATGLDRHFQFYRDQSSAITALAAATPNELIFILFRTWLRLRS